MEELVGVPSRNPGSGYGRAWFRNNTVHLTTFACYSVLGRWASGGRLFHARYHRGIHRARDGGLRRSPAAVAGRVLWPGDLPLLRRSCSSASTAAECTIE